MHMYWIAAVGKQLVLEILESIMTFLLSPQSEYFHGLSKEPVISTLSACEALDSSGGKALEVELYCTINGVEKVPLWLIPTYM